MPNHRSSRYRVLVRPQGDGIQYYLGKSGSVRWGRTIASSIPFHPGFKAALLEAAEKFPTATPAQFRLEVARIPYARKENQS